MKHSTHMQYAATGRGRLFAAMIALLVASGVAGAQAVVSTTPFAGTTILVDTPPEGLLLAMVDRPLLAGSQPAPSVRPSLPPTPSPTTTTATRLAITPQASPSAATAAMPLAPSTLLVSEQGETLAKTAGSTFRWTAPTTGTGPGGVRIEQAQAGVLRLSLDDAIALGLTRNLRMQYDRANLQSAKGFTLSVLNVFTPNLSINGSSNAQEIDLAAMGFKASLLAGSGLLPPGYVFSTIVKVKVTQASINLRQTLFSMPDFELYKGTKNVTRNVDLVYQNDRGGLVTSIGQAYLRVVADQANQRNAEAQERSARTLYEQAKAKLDAGVGTNLDALRGQVEYQQRQQQTVQAGTQVAEDTIQLDRTIGLPAGQQLELTDTAPFAELGAMDESEALATAYLHRKDLLQLHEQIALSNHVLKAVKYQRLPVLAVNGFYGVIGQTDTGSYHGNFNAEGTLAIPVFREAAQRGEADVAAAQLTALKQQEASLRATIDAQIRAALLDVDSGAELVKVAQSSVALAEQELADERDRFAAGVDDNLPVVDAEATVVQSRSQLVNALFQYNVAKLTLARNVGVVETRYRSFLAGQ